MSTDGDGGPAPLAAAARIEPALIEALKASLTPFAAEAGELLFRQNDPADGMHVIGEGLVRVQGRTLADGLVQLAEVGPGDIVGEWKMIGGPEGADAVIVASEPLTRDVATWVEVPEYSALCVSRDGGDLRGEVVTLDA
jgi:CRP-like cAMP-binding protein